MKLYKGNVIRLNYYVKNLENKLKKYLKVLFNLSVYLINNFGHSNKLNQVCILQTNKFIFKLNTSVI